MLVVPTGLRDKAFKDLAKLLKNHFKPKPLIIAERFTFHRQAGETVIEYLAEL